MSRLFAAIFVLFLCAVPSFGQATDTTICNVLSHPEGLDGKMVRIKGQVIAGFDQFQLQDYKCTAGSAAIWLSYPEGSKVKSGPAATVTFQLAQNNPNSATAANRAPVQLTKDKDFKTFDSLLTTPYKGKAPCLGCNRYTVTATLTGRLDVSEKTGVLRDAKGQVTGVAGFGNMNRYNVRLVIASVTDVTPEEIDFSKAAINVETTLPSDGGDAMAMAQKSAAAYPAGTPAAQMQTAAVNAFGKPKENNGVLVSFSRPNEASNNDGAKSTTTSPDGLVATVTIDKDKVKFMPPAIVHLGVHIADIRNPEGDAKADNLETGFYESRGIYGATGQFMAVGVKEVVLPGGFESWNGTWKPEQAGDFLNRGISQTLAWMNQKMN